MRYSREHSEATRKRILASAARLFREGGLAGTGIDAVAAEAEVTSGAIYRAFGSKEGLFEAVVQDGVQRLVGGIERLRRAAPETWPQALSDWYLGAEHVAAPGAGCLLPSLTPDIARGAEPARALFEAGLRQAARAAAGAQTAGVPAAGAAAEGRAGVQAAVPQEGWATLATLAGAVLLARAVGPGGTQAEILEAAARALAAGPSPEG